VARLDVNEYREKYLKLVEERVMSHKDDIANFTTQNLHEAIMSEMNRADPDTWEVEVPDDQEQALKEAEQRVLNHMKTHKDLGLGKSF
jgi:lipoate-protein ligase A